MLCAVKCLLEGMHALSRHLFNSTTSILFARRIEVVEDA